MPPKKHLSANSHNSHPSKRLTMSRSTQKRKHNNPNNNRNPKRPKVSSISNGVLSSLVKSMSEMHISSSTNNAANGMRHSQKLPNSTSNNMLFPTKRSLTKSKHSRRGSI